jgi:hypothetical protein
MNLLNFPKIKSKKLLSILVCVSLTGCQSMQVLPDQEYEEFNAKPQQDRIINQVKVHWEVQDNVAEFCVKAMRRTSDDKYQGQANITPPLACAVWHTTRKECIIYTNRKTTHTALGHELRHCFEGHFH